MNLRPKSRLLLETLQANADRIVGKDELIRAVWGHDHVEPQALFQLISEIRQAHGDRHCIATYPNRGYRWQGRSAHRARAGWSLAAAAGLLALVIGTWQWQSPATSAPADPSWSPALTALARGLDHRASGDLESATALMELAVRENPRFALARLELAQTLMLAGNAEQATRMAYDALSDARIAEDRYLEISAQLLLSRLNWERGDLAGAVALSRQAGEIARREGYVCAARVTEDLSRRLATALIDPPARPLASPVLSLSACRLELGPPEAADGELEKFEGIRSPLNATV